MEWVAAVNVVASGSARVAGALSEVDDPMRRVGAGCRGAVGGRRPDAAGRRGLPGRCRRSTTRCGGPARVAGALSEVDDPMRRAGARWSASMYLWHLVDVVRISAERLLTLEHDAEAGVPCWDENALALARRYDRLSAAVGAAMLELETQVWLDVANAAPLDVVVEHPLFGDLGALELVRRTAHEVHHHLRDVAESYRGARRQRVTAPTAHPRDVVGSEGTTFVEPSHLLPTLNPQTARSPAGEGIEPASLKVRFALELAVARDAPRVERTDGDRRQDCTSRFASVAAVAEATCAGELVDLGEDLVEGDVPGQGQAPQSRRVDQHPAAWQAEKLPRRRRVAAAAVVFAHRLGHLHVSSHERVRERRLPRPGRPEQEAGPSG